ncbi:hypothetical protein V6Z12_D09G013300 [Gossypium hirsutum]
MKEQFEITLKPNWWCKITMNKKMIKVLASSALQGRQIQTSFQRNKMILNGTFSFHSCFHWLFVYPGLFNWPFPWAMRLYPDLPV